MEKNLLENNKNEKYNEENEENSNSESNKWLQFANDLRSQDKENFFSSYKDLVNEIIEEIHDDTESFSLSSYMDLSNDVNYDSENSESLKYTNTSAKDNSETFQHEQKDINIQNSVKSSVIHSTNTINKKKPTAIALFCESMASTISKANLPLEEILQIQKEILDIVTNRIEGYKDDEN